MTQTPEAQERMERLYRSANINLLNTIISVVGICEHEGRHIHGADYLIEHFKTNTIPEAFRLFRANMAG